jgi:peptide/nickel transport system permease protein
MITKIFSNYVVKRFITYLLTIFVTFTATFFFFRLIPGNPIGAFILSMQQRYSTIVVQGGENVVEKYQEMFGLNGSLFTQYIRYTKNVLRGNLGPSLTAFPTPAQNLIITSLPWTIGLLGLSLLISWAIGILIGTLVGWKRDLLASKIVTALAIFFSQVPQYFFALILVFFLAYTIMVLPSSGAYNPFLTPGFNLEFIFSVIKHGLLPSLSIILTTAMGWIISTRALVISILGEDYLIFAEAKGLKPSTVLRQYVMRNALLPQITGLAISLGFIMNGAYIVEWVFNYPGIGRLMANAIGILDYNLIQGIVILSIVAVLTANLIIDLILPLIDPRIRAR